MMHDDDLRARFDELRSARAPVSYDVVADAARREVDARGRRRRRARATLAATLPVLAVLAWFGMPLLRGDDELPDPETLHALVNWHSPTASLLQNPYTEWMQSTPSLEESVIILP